MTSECKGTALKARAEFILHPDSRLSVTVPVLSTYIFLHNSDFRKLLYGVFGVAGIKHWECLFFFCHSKMTQYLAKVRIHSDIISFSIFGTNNYPAYSVTKLCSDGRL